MQSSFVRIPCHERSSGAVATGLNTTVISVGRLTDSLFSWQEDKTNRDEAGTERNDAPHNSLPNWGLHGRRNLSSRRNPKGAPNRNVSVVEAVDLMPSRKREQRFVIAVANEDVFKSVTRRMFQHLPQSQHPFGVIELRTAQLSHAMITHFRKAAGGVVFPVNAWRLGVTRNFRHHIRKSQS